MKKNSLISDARVEIENGKGSMDEESNQCSYYEILLPAGKGRGIPISRLVKCLEDHEVVIGVIETRTPISVVCEVNGEEINGHKTIQDNHSASTAKDIYVQFYCPRSVFEKVEFELSTSYRARVQRLSSGDSAKRSLRDVPWFPSRASDLDFCTVEQSDYHVESFPSDHPCFTDVAYRERRRQIAKLSQNFQQLR